jgi:hypothetical protein
MGKEIPAGRKTGDITPSCLILANSISSFDVARGDVDGLGNLAPVMKIAKDLPIRIAVIDIEKFTARGAGSIRYRLSLPF